MSLIGSWNIHSTCDNHLIVKGQQLVALWCISLFLMIQSCVRSVAINFFDANWFIPCFPAIICDPVMLYLIWKQQQNSVSLWHFKCGARYDKNMSACSGHWQECAKLLTRGEDDFVVWKQQRQSLCFCHISTLGATRDKRRSGCLGYIKTKLKKKKS